MGVPQYTTPTFSLTFEEDGLDLTQAENVYVTFRSWPNVLTKSGGQLTITRNTIQVYLTQSDTKQFRIGDLEIQANWTMADGSRVASEIVKYPITEQLLKKVVE